MESVTFKACRHINDNGGKCGCTAYDFYIFNASFLSIKYRQCGHSLARYTDNIDESGSRLVLSEVDPEDESIIA